MQGRLVAAAIAFAGICWSAPQAAPGAPPKLAVIIVVDQMRADYVDRFNAEWTGGLKRMVTQGAWFQQAAYPYLTTVTCAGHATIATGSFPHLHGIIQNAWWDRAHPIQIDRYWSGVRAPSSRHAEARILWSNKALHLRFVCHQNESLIVNDKPQSEKKTMGLWDRDVCEIFIAPDSHVVERYFEFEAAPTGEWLDVAIHWTPEKRESDWEFASHMTTAARI